MYIYVSICIYVYVCVYVCMHLSDLCLGQQPQFSLFLIWAQGVGGCERVRGSRGRGQPDQSVHNTRPTSQRVATLDAAAYGGGGGAGERRPRDARRAPVRAGNSTRLYIYVYIYMYIYIYICMYIYVYMYIYSGAGERRTCNARRAPVRAGNSTRPAQGLNVAYRRVKGYGLTLNPSAG